MSTAALAASAPSGLLSLLAVFVLLPVPLAVL